MVDSFENGSCVRCFHQDLAIHIHLWLRFDKSAELKRINAGQSFCYESLKRVIRCDYGVDLTAFQAFVYGPSHLLHHDDYMPLIGGLFESWNTESLAVGAEEKIQTRLRNAKSDLENSRHAPESDGVSLYP